MLHRNLILSRQTISCSTFHLERVMYGYGYADNRLFMYGQFGSFKTAKLLPYLERCFKSVPVVVARAAYNLSCPFH